MRSRARCGHFSVRADSKIERVPKTGSRLRMRVLSMSNVAVHFENAVPTSANELIEWMDGRITEILLRVEASDVWRAVVLQAHGTELAVEVLKEIYLEIVMYQPDSIEAAVASI